MELNKTYLVEDLGQLSTSELEQMLRAEVKKSVPNGPLVQSLLKALETRKAEYTAADNEAVEAACAQYQVYCDDVQRKTTKVQNLVLKVASVVLVIGLLLFAAPQIVKANQLRVMFQRWTESVFELFGPLYQDSDETVYMFDTDHPGLQQVYDAVKELGITDPVVPTWLPDGYELLEIKDNQSPSKNGFCAVFADGNNSLFYTVDIYNPEMAHSYFKGADSPTIYEYEGIEHNVISNKGRHIAIWTIENIGFSITADCQVEEIYKIIDSIYTTEDD